MPKRWEYCTVKFGAPDRQSVEVVYGTGSQKIPYAYDEYDSGQMKILDMLGAQGWEAISSSRSRFGLNNNPSVADALVKVWMKRELP